MYIFKLIFYYINSQGFIATFPSSVLPNSTAKFCIQFFDLNSNVELTVTDSTKESEPSFESFQIIYRSDGKITQYSLSCIWNKILWLCIDIQKCNDIQIKDLNHNTDEQKKIKITGTNENKTYSFKDEKLFQYKPFNSFTIIETDKPVYKPGQKSNFI